MNFLLCGRPIGRITRLARPSECLSVCLSVCPFVLAPNSNTKKRRKMIFTSVVIFRQTFPWARVGGLPIFRWKVKRSRTSKTSRAIWRHVYMYIMASRSSVCCSGAHCMLDVAGNFQPSRSPAVAPGRTAAYHVGADSFACLFTQFKQYSSTTFRKI